MSHCAQQADEDVTVDADEAVRDEIRAVLREVGRKQYDRKKRVLLEVLIEKHRRLFGYKLTQQQALEVTRPMRTGKSPELSLIGIDDQPNSEKR